MSLRSEVNEDESRRDNMYKLEALEENLKCVTNDVALVQS